MVEFTSTFMFVFNSMFTRKINFALQTTPDIIIIKLFTFYGSVRKAKTDPVSALFHRAEFLETTILAVLNRLFPR